MGAILIVFEFFQNRLLQDKLSKFSVHNKSENIFFYFFQEFPRISLKSESILIIVGRSNCCFIFKRFN